MQAEAEKAGKEWQEPYLKAAMEEAEALIEKAKRRKKRPEKRDVLKEEIDALMDLFYDYLIEALRDFSEENIRTIFIGDVTAFSPKLQQLIHETEEISSDKTGMRLNIAMNYGGRNEIVKAMREISQEVADGKLKPEDISSEIISDHMYTFGQPDPDLIIRPSGEYRTSNFLLWQSAYSEYVFMDEILWPDFSTEDLERALDEYSRRNRRFGGV